MKYKLISVLKTKHVEPWAEYIYGERIPEKSQPASSAAVVRKAVECGWFDGDVPDVDELEPHETVALAKVVFEAYSKSMGFNTKNSSARPQTTPKE
jgi:hypothetical protein